MSGDICAALAHVDLNGELSVGSLVRLVGLKRSEFNHHVGQVVTGMDERGRIGVLLHAAIFHDDEPTQARKEYAPMSFSRANLREVKQPTPGVELSSRGTLSRTLLLRMFGEKGLGLPDDVTDRIVHFLTLHVFTPSDTVVSGCSSNRGDFPLSAAVNSNEAEWWISSAGSTPSGIGNEYLEFSFGGFRRISYVALKIPPLPWGPLSVRKFHLLALRQGMRAEASQSLAWTLASENPLQTLDRADLQEFALVPPCETESLRLVCTVNAAAAAAEGGGSARGRGAADCIGLFQVCFA
jgi:hypothetical protein